MGRQRRSNASSFDRVGLLVVLALIVAACGDHEVLPFPDLFEGGMEHAFSEVGLDIVVQRDDYLPPEFMASGRTRTFVAEVDQSVCAEPDLECILDILSGLDGVSDVEIRDEDEALVYFSVEQPGDDRCTGRIAPKGSSGSMLPEIEEVLPDDRSRLLRGFFDCGWPETLDGQ